MKYIVIFISAIVFLFGDVLDKTSYYIAYDKNDPSMYVLVMPKVQRVYVHKAGHILPSDLTDITNEFVGFPTYSDGKVCFSSVKADATNAEAKVMENQCYECNFFYIQYKAISEGYTFLLYYKPASKLYEGLAGKASSFKVVRDENGVYDDESISGSDFTDFDFDFDTGVAFTGADAIEHETSSDSSSMEMPPSPPSTEDDSSSSDDIYPPSIPDTTN